MTTPHDDEITCPRCKGRGFVLVGTYTHKDGGTNRVHGDCEICAGEGSLSAARYAELTQDIDDGEAFDLDNDR